MLFTIAQSGPLTATGVLWAAKLNGTDAVDLSVIDNGNGSTITVETSVNNSAWTAFTGGFRLINGGLVALGAATITGKGSYYFPTAGIVYMRFRVSTYVSGSVVVDVQPGTVPSSNLNASPVSSVSRATDEHEFQASDGSIQFRIAAVLAAVNWLETQGGINNSAPVMVARGANTDIDFNFAAKGKGGFYIYNGRGTIFQARDVDSGLPTANYVVTINASANGHPRLAAEGSDTNINLVLAAKGTGVVDFLNPARRPSYTVAGLPSAATVGTGAMAMVTDATQTFASANYGATPTGGGANRVPVISDGTVWRIG